MEAISKRNRDNENDPARSNGIASGSASNLEASRKDEGSNSRVPNAAEAGTAAGQIHPGKTTVELRLRHPLPSSLPATRIGNPIHEQEVECIGGGKTPITGTACSIRKCDYR